MTTPTFAAVADDTATLLDLIASDADRLPWVADEWATFTTALEVATDPFTGCIRQAVMRAICREEELPPKHIGPFYRRACREGLIEWRGDWEPSTDKEGGNAGRPIRIYYRKETQRVGMEEK